jgi:hypothetical protein
VYVLSLTTFSTLPSRFALWDGTDAYTITGILPPGSLVNANGLLAANGKLYIALWDNTANRMYEYTPTTGAVRQIGDTQADGAFTPSIAWAYGSLFFASSGKIYRITPDLESTWTLDHTLADGQTVGHLEVYQGKLYLGCVGAGGLTKILVRDSAGAWSLSTSEASTGLYGRLAVFDSKLFASFVEPGAASKIVVFDGSSWTTDEDLVATFTFDGGERAGMAVTFKGDLYWAFGRPADYPTENGSLLKRVTGGTWTRQIANRCLTGGMAFAGG